MTDVKGEGLQGEESADRLETAVAWFMRVRSQSARVEDLPELRSWLEADARNVQAYRQVSASWQSVGAFASEPELVIGRRDALDDARQAAEQRWSVRASASSKSALRSVGRWSVALAACALIAVLGTVLWYTTYRGVHETAIGERRTLTLEDGSIVALDARSRIRVDYSDHDRVIDLEKGQARFNVAKDLSRPFRVRARDQTVIALGTQFNVEIVARNVLVTLLEGRVAVSGRNDAIVGPTVHTAPASRSVELSRGEALRVREDGRATLIPSVDVERTTAWQSGKLFFDNEPLQTAIERVNRYARKPVQIDASVADLGISGVFNAGDAHAFIEAVTTYFPVEADETADGDVRLTARK